MVENPEQTVLPKLPADLSLTPEFRLLAACSWLAPPKLEALQQDRIAAVCRERIDWDEFQSLIRYHGVQPLAQAALKFQANALVPDRVRAMLKEGRVQTSIRSLQQGAELVRLIKRFNAQGIEMIPLKGVALSLKLYGDPGMRNSSDLDILVKPEDLEKACRLLEADGFQCGLHGVSMSARQKGYIRRNLYHLEYSHEVKGVHVELHWNLGSLWNPGQVAELWNSMTHTTWMGTRVNSLDDDALLLFLSDHGARHRYYCLKWLSDVARLLSCDRPKGWEGVLALADRVDLTRALTHSALLAHWIYGIPLDGALRHLILKDRYAVMMSRKVHALMLESAAGKAALGKRLGSLKLAWQVLRLRSSLPILKTLKPTLIAASDFHDFPLPDRLFWLYYPLRPVSWLWRFFLKK